MNKYYKSIEVWEKKSHDSVVVYQVFQRLTDGYYAIQSKDTYYCNNNLKKQKESFFNQKIQLFLQEDIENREVFVPSIEDAIKKFNMDFEE